MTARRAGLTLVRGLSRDRIVEVSLGIVEREGADRLTIRRIATRVKRTQPAIYQHFASKDDLLTAIAVEGFAALVRCLGDASRPPGRALLPAITDAYVRFGLERPRLYQVMFVDPPVIAFAAGPRTPAPAHAAFRILSGAVAATGGVESAQTETATEVLWASLHGLVTLSITGRLRARKSLHLQRLSLLNGALDAAGCRNPRAARTRSPVRSR